MKYLTEFFPVGKQGQMKNSAQHIIEILFGREKLEDVTVNQLKDLVKEYPAFNIGHYLLSKKLQAENHEEFLPETKKTALYINNPFWLQWLLQQVNDEPISSSLAGQQFVHQKGTSTTTIYPDEPGDLLVKPAIFEQPPVSDGLPVESSTEQPEETNRQSFETANFQQTQGVAEEIPETIALEKPENLAEEALDTNSFAQPEQIAEEPAEASVFQPTETLVDEPIETAVSFEEGKPSDQPFETAHFDQYDQEIVQAVETDFNTETGQFFSPAEDAEDKIGKSEGILAETSTSSESSPAAMDEPSSDQPDFASENRELSAFTIEEPKLEEIAFDPYHTIDYFASQGIKFVQEENPSDKLGKQLKSFTDWLKVMKRLPPKALETITDDAGEADVEIIAAHSIEEKDVITEAMAAVLAKQGKNEKAIETYEKLSLLDPGKSHYFASKIEELKIPDA
jgi:hypothetical protein